jgi:hypothetical protein
MKRSAFICAQPKMVISAHGSPLLSESGFAGLQDLQDFFPPPT